jgi:peroxisomal 3,2-trans-enoyl-CoA isomerase
MDLNLLLPPLPTTPPSHPQLHNARFHKDEKTGESYLNIIDVDEGKIRILEMNRKKAKNGFDDWQYLVVSDALNDSANNDKILVVIITGTDEAGFFSSGADLRAEAAGGQSLKLGDNVIDPVGVFMRTMLRFPKPIVAALNNSSIGVGATMLAHCDIVYSVEDAYVLTPFSRIGVVCEFGSSYLFPKLMGSSLANEMLLFGKQIPTRRLKEVGFISEIFPKVGFRNRVLEEVRNALVYPLLDKTLPKFKHMIKRLELDFLERLIVYELNELTKRAESGETFEAVMIFMQQSAENKMKGSKL